MDNDNDASLSVLASAGVFDVLITGDMDSQVEEILSEEKHLSDVEVLVVGHHGSRYSTSTDFLKEITPQVAVISVGDNSYGPSHAGGAGPVGCGGGECVPDRPQRDGDDKR